MSTAEENSLEKWLHLSCYRDLFNAREEVERGSTDLYSCLRQVDLHGELLPKNKKTKRKAIITQEKKNQGRVQPRAGVCACELFVILLLQ